MDKSILRQYYYAFACNLNVFVSAMSFAWIEPMTWHLSRSGNYKMTPDDISWLVSIVELGCLIAPIPSGLFADRYGRRTVMLSVPICFVLSWLIILTCRSRIVLILARIIQGVGIGVAFTIVPIYIAEISDANIRGRLSGHIQTMWYLGILFIYISGLFLNFDFYIGLCILFSFLCLFLSWTVIETPYFFIMKSMIHEAHVAMERLKPFEKIQVELEVLKSAVRDEMTGEGYVQMFKNKSDRKALWIVLLVCATRYLSGMPSLVNYASDTFAVSTPFPFSKEHLTILLGALLTIIAFISSNLSDVVGRRRLLLISGFGCFISHFLLGVYFYIGEKIQPPNYLFYIGIVGFCIFSDLGLAPISQTLQAEMFSSNTRGIGGGITGTFNALICFINLKTYITVTNIFGLYMNFFIYAVVCITGTFLIKIMIRETAKKTLTEISTNLKFEIK